MSWRSLLGGGRRGRGTVPARNSLVHEPGPAEPRPLDAFALCAVLKTWMDEDVVEATVRNAFAQGVDAVFVVDNASTDATVARAEAAGATVAEVYRTDVFDGRLVQPLMNAVVARESLRRGDQHVWWLYLDSDEFPEGPDGTTVRQYLAGLDRRFRAVGASYVNHLPSGGPAYLPGFHPIDFQPLCYPFVPARWPPCDLGHWKHPLQRFDRRGHFLLANEGAHAVHCDEPVPAPLGGIVTHHFQYRDEALTRAKLELTAARARLHEAAGFDGFTVRRRSLDAVYAGRWGEVETVPVRDPDAARHPAPWPALDRVRRWYDMADVAAARAAWRAGTLADSGRRP